MMGFGVASSLVATTMLMDIGYCTFHGYCWSWGDHHWVMGIVSMLIGAAMIAGAFWPNKHDQKAMYICPKCEAVHSYAEVKDEVCPVCGAKMEPLKGFYKRHPERKED